MTDLPDGWEWSTLDEVLAVQGDGRTIHQGWSPQCDKEPGAADEWAALKTTAIQPGRFESEHNKRLPSDKEPRPALEVRRGDLLLTCAGPRSRCGIACLVRETRSKLMISGKMYRFRFDPDHIDPGYMEFYLQSSRAWTAIDEMKTGVSDSGLNLTQGRIRALPVPVPPIPEQRRIVAAIEEQFSRLDAAEAGISQSLCRLDQLAPRTLDRALAESTSWPTARMGDIAQLSLGKMLDQKQQTGLHPTPYLRNINVRWDRFDLNGLAEMDIAPKELERSTVRSGDLVMCEGGEPGRSAVWRGDKPIAIQKALHRIRLHDDVVPEFVALLFRQLATSHKLDRYFTGSTIKHLPKQQLARIEIALPPIETQRRCVALIEDLESDVSRTRSALETALKRSGALRRSILTAAFSGQLAPQDPADEPASLLLQRIAAEQAASKPSRKRKKAAL